MFYEALADVLGVPKGVRYETIPNPEPAADTKCLECGDRWGEHFGVECDIPDTGRRWTI